MTDPQTRPFPGRRYWIATALIVLFMIAPIVIATTAESIAGSHGCALHEGFANACTIGGSDWGDTLYGGFVLGWMFFLTGPLGIVALVILFAVKAWHRGRWARQD